MSKKLSIEKLKSSGLSATDAEKLNIEYLAPDKTIKLHKSFKDRPALKFNYMNPMKPKQHLKQNPKWPPFYRLRYLGKSTDTATVLGANKAHRYVQEPHSPVCAYFPTNIDWLDIVNDPTVPLIITEGELKAAKACKQGFPTIGLGGVYSFRSAKMGITFLPELKAINWVKRTVYIVYDSDFKTNEQVCNALNALATTLEAEGAIPFVVSLPDVTADGKTGLDDFMVQRTDAEFMELLDRAQPITLARHLWELNKMVLYIYNPGLVLIKETDQKISPSAFKEHAFNTHTYAEQILNKDGSISMKPASAASHWIKWPLRSEAGCMTYRPGQPKVIANNSVLKSEYNLWPGWAVEPKKGDIKPFLTLIDHIFQGTDKTVKKWFLNWCAYPIQHPGVKLFTSAVIYGVLQGTGKSLIGYTLGKIYGKNFTEIKQGDLHGNFNEWAEGKQFILGDEVTGSDRRQDADMLKNLITQKELRVNMKYLPSYVVPDCINYLFTSNHPDAFFLEDNDRRFFIHEVSVKPLPEQFYKSYWEWLNSGGAEALFDYFLKLDTKGFNPSAPALRTDAKVRMIADTKSDLGEWVASLLADTDNVLRVGKVDSTCDLYSSKQLLHLYDPLGRTGTTANGVGRELRKSNVPLINQGNPVKTSDGQMRLYILKNHSKWEGATIAQARDHLEANTVAISTPKKDKY